MNKIKTFFLGAGVAGANLLASASAIFRAESCAGSCGNCNYACVPTVFALIGAGGLVIAYRKLKLKFLERRSRG